MPILQSRLGSGGGGGGDATAANQQKQIDQLAEASNYPSVLKDNIDLSVFANATQRSVFKDDATMDSVFKDGANANVFIHGGKSIGDRIYFIEENLRLSTISTGTTVVTSFSDVTLAGVASQLQTFLQANINLRIINISFSSAAAAQHDVLLTYNN